MDLIRLLFAIVLPPVGVFLQVGFGGQFWASCTRCGSSRGVDATYHLMSRSATWRRVTTRQPTEFPTRYHVCVVLLWRDGPWFRHDDGVALGFPRTDFDGVSNVAKPPSIGRAA
jgi:hypothetical protein